MYRYFLDSAKNIIKSEGIEALSVRSVADKAGYSYATLYNYYKDVKELAYMSACEFITECSNYVTDFNYNTTSPAELIKLKTKKMCEFYIQYSGIYQLLFITGVNNVGNIVELKDKLNNLHQTIFKSDFDSLFADKSDFVMNLFINLLSGSLLLYINRRTPDSFIDFRNNLDKQIDVILNFQP
jgi:hypothetical protein